MSNRPLGKFHPVYLWIVVPFVALLWVPIFNRVEPTLFGIPFFYWYQAMGTLLGAAVHRPRLSACAKAEESPRSGSARPFRIHAGWTKRGQVKEMRLLPDLSLDNRDSQCLLKKIKVGVRRMHASWGKWHGR